MELVRELVNLSRQEKKLWDEINQTNKGKKSQHPQQQQENNNLNLNLNPNDTPEIRLQFLSQRKEEILHQYHSHLQNLLNQKNNNPSLTKDPHHCLGLFQEQITDLPLKEAQNSDVTLQFFQSLSILLSGGACSSRLL